MPRRKTAAPPPAEGEISRKYITPDEFGRLVDACAQVGRNVTRDRALLHLMYWHGLRVTEAVTLQWHDVNWTTESIHVHRLKNGRDSVHPIHGGRGKELRAIRALKKEAGELASGYIFRSERNGPLSADMVARIIGRAGAVAGLGFHVNPHMLRHGCGFRLANQGRDTRLIQQYLGHSQISSTVIYTELAPNRFQDINRD